MLSELFDISSFVVGTSANGGPNFGLFCGGALISTRTVLTGENYYQNSFVTSVVLILAAHCVDQRTLMRKGWYLRGVRLGEWDLMTDPDCDANTNVCAPPVMEQGIAQVMVHSDFIPHSKEQFNDIALVKMRSSVEYSDFVKPICLPESSIDQSFDNSPLVVAGFGKTETSDESRIKLKTDIQGTSFQKCRQVYGQARIANTQICAIGDFGRDSW